MSISTMSLPLSVGMLTSSLSSLGYEKGMDWVRVCLHAGSTRTEINALVSMSVCMGCGIVQAERAGLDGDQPCAERNGCGRDVFSKAGQLYVPQLHFLPWLHLLTTHLLHWTETRPYYYKTCYYKLAHIRSLEPTSQLTQPALDAIAIAISNLAVFNFDPLFKLSSLFVIDAL